jgi:hypothetical protein
MHVALTEHSLFGYSISLSCFLRLILNMPNAPNAANPAAVTVKVPQLLSGVT